MMNTSHFVRRIGRRNQEQLLSEINVTPMVDVMLVLLIIFMVTGQMLASGTEVDLPDAPADALENDMEAVRISVDAQQNIFIGETMVAPEAFASTLSELALAYEDPQSQTILVRADRSLPYGVVMETVSQVAEAGFSKVVFVSDPEASPVTADPL
jgi:biopolymer transport protein TolR